MSGNSVFIPLQVHNWQGGLHNLMRAEFARWYHTRLWWTQTILWSAIIGGILIPVLREVDVTEGLMVFSLFSGVFASVAAVIIMQDALVGEKETGTAAWVLSKPVSHQAFYLSKLIPNIIGVFTSMILPPAIIFYLEIVILQDYYLDLLRFGIGIGVIWINVIFYQTLTHMLGSFFISRAPVIGITLGFNFSQQFIFGLVPALTRFLPWTLVMPYGGNEHSLSSSIMRGTSSGDFLPLITAILLIMVFTAVGLWRFSKEEF